MDRQAEVRALHEQFSAAWSLYARCTGVGEVVDLEGLRIANGRQPWFLLNAALLTAPASSQVTLAARARAAIAYFAREHRPWFFAGSQQWLGEGALDTLARLGLTQALTVVGMVADELAPPVRPLPEVETRRIDAPPGRLALADLNAAVYDVAAEWVRGAVAGEALWHTPLYGYVAYADGTPISTALAIPLHGILGSVSKVEMAMFTLPVQRHSD